MTPVRAVVVGSINVDHLLAVRQLPAAGETVAGEWRTAGGGKGANQAVALARLGADCRLVGCVGQDAAGAEQLAELVREGVDVSLVARTSALPTGAAYVTVEGTGENTIVVVAGANTRVRPLTADRLRGAQLLLAQLEVPAATVLTSLRRAAAARVLTVLNASPAANATPDLLGAAEVLVVNAGEARELASRERVTRSGVSAARVLHGYGARVVVVTLGAAGCLVLSADTVREVPAVAAHALDTTGAGDCFAAALGLALAQGRPACLAARFAVAAAAHAVTRTGARAGLPTPDAVRRSMRTGQVTVRPPQRAGRKCRLIT